jgi:hypothetical protein
MATRYNPPPGRQPDHSRPGLPAVVLAGGSAVTLGSLMPFVSYSGIGLGIGGGSKLTSAAFGLVIIALGVMLHRAVQQPARRITGLATVGLSGLGTLGYAGFIAIGTVGWPSKTRWGTLTRSHFHPPSGSSSRSQVARPPASRPSGRSRTVNPDIHTGQPNPARCI